MSMTVKPSASELRQRTTTANGKNKATNGNGNGESSRTKAAPSPSLGAKSARPVTLTSRSRASVMGLDEDDSAHRSNGDAAGGERLDQRQLLSALTAFKKGELTARLPLGLSGIDGKIADTFNEVIEMNQRLAAELSRLSKVVGKEGKLSQRASIGEVTGAWAEKIEAVNTLIDDLVHPTTETARVIGAVAKGDLSQEMALEIEGRPLAGEFLRTAKTVNTMVNQLGSFASEVTRVAREVGTEGKLGGQAKVKGVAGTWKDLTDSVNSMAGNLTSQVRSTSRP